MCSPAYYALYALQANEDKTCTSYPQLVTQYCYILEYYPLYNVIVFIYRLTTTDNKMSIQNDCP